MIALINRRFVPFYFDLSDSGAAADPEARAFVVRAKPELGKCPVPTPPLLIMTPEGEVLTEVSNYAPADRVLEVMQRVLRAHPQYDRLSPEEQKVRDPLARGQLLFELMRWDEATDVLARSEADAALYLLGHIARWRRDWKAMERWLSKVRDPALADDVRMERAYRLWYARRFKELADWLRDFPRASHRYSEARYYYGLALYHLGKRQRALDVWADLIRTVPEGPWVYRADWAYTSLQQGSRLSFSTRGPRISLLGRIGYMGPPNPDLQQP